VISLICAYEFNLLKHGLVLHQQIISSLSEDHYGDQEGKMASKELKLLQNEATVGACLCTNCLNCHKGLFVSVLCMYWNLS
jgi:hypothetical protein